MKRLLVLFVFFASVSGCSVAHAAEMFFVLDDTQHLVDDTFAVEVRIKSEDKGFNAAQASVTFDPQVLSVVSIDSSPDASAFNFWLEQPSAASGAVRFVGGTTNGILGASVEILSITFKAVHAGTTAIATSGAAVTASDGTGANILESTHAQIITITSDTTPQITTLVTDTSDPAPKPAPISSVRIVQRKATPASELPHTPSLSIPLYPDDTWSNKTGPFLVEWPLSDDIIRVATQVNSTGSDDPARAEGLFDAKTFATLADGVWYVHVQFKNSKGWGQTAHRRIRVDTTPPTPFTIDVHTTKQYDPAPMFSFATQDALSGIDHYVVSIDGTATSVDTGTFTPSPLAPGAHTVVVRAVDAADNQREANTTFTVLPLPLPSITHTNTPLFVGEAPLEVEGMAPSSNQVFLFARNENGALIDRTAAITSSDGVFRATFGRLFAKGAYTVALVSETTDGAQSLVVISDPVFIRERPLITIRGVGITQLWFFVVLLCMLVGTTAAGALSHHFWYAKLRDRVYMARRDTDVVFSMLSRDIEELLKSYKDHKITKREATKDEKRLKKVLDDLEKTHRYTKNNINEIIES